MDGLQITGHRTGSKYPLDVCLPLSVSKLSQSVTPTVRAHPFFFILQPESFVNRLYFQLLPLSPTASFFTPYLTILGLNTNSKHGYQFIQLPRVNFRLFHGSSCSVNTGFTCSVGKSQLPLIFFHVLNMQTHTPQVDPHLHCFLCDVLVQLGGSVLVEAMKKHLKESRRGENC